MSGADSPVPRVVDAAAREAVIGEYLKALKLPAFAAEYQGLVRQATDAGWGYEDFLRELLEAELRSREERTAKRRLKEARFPEVKTLEQLDWEALEGVSRHKIMELSSCEFLTQAQDCIIAGPVGTGKTHVAISIGVEAARRRFRVAFFSGGGAGAAAYRSARREDTHAAASALEEGRAVDPR